MSVYNSARWLAETLDSILAQTFTDFEVVAIEDESSDGSGAILDDYARRDSRVRVFHNRPSLGLIPSHNMGIEKARGEYIARIDADDLCFPTRIEKQVAWLDAHPGTAAVGALIRRVASDGRHSGFWTEDLATTDAKSIERMLPAKNCIAHSSLMVRGDVLRRFGYVKDLKFSEDYNLNLRMWDAGLTLEKVPEILIHYRVHGTSLSSAHLWHALLLTEFKSKAVFFKSAVLDHGLGARERLMAREVLRSAHRWLYHDKRPYKALCEIPNYLRYQLTPPSRARKQYAGAAEKTGRPNLLLVMTSLGRGDADHVMLSAARSLAPEFNLHLIATAAGEASAHEAYLPYCNKVTVPAKRHAPRTRQELRTYMRRAVDLDRTDAILLNETVPGSHWYADLRRRGAAIPAADIHHTVGAETNSPRMTWMTPLLERRVCSSRLMLDHMRALYESQKLGGGDRLRLVPNGIELGAWRREGAPAAGRTVVWNNEFVEDKDPLLFVQVVAEYKKQGSGVRFVMAGDGPLLALTRRVAAQMGVGDMIQFAGPLGEAQTRALLSSAWLLVMTSINEGIPAGALQAMALGVPVVATAAGAIGEVIENGRSGLLLEPVMGFDAEAARAIMRLESNPGEYEALALAARPAIARYDLDSVAGELRAVLGEVIAAKAGAKR